MKHETTTPKAPKGKYIVLGTEEVHNYNKGTIKEITRTKNIVNSKLKGIRMANQIKLVDNVNNIFLVNDKGETLMTWTWITTLDGEGAYWVRHTH